MFSGAADQVSSFTHGDPRFAVTSNSSNIKHRRLLSAPGLPLHGNTRRDTHARTHTSAFLYACMHVLFVPRRICVCVCSEDNGWAPDEIFKKEQHVACKVLEVTSAGGKRRRKRKKQVTSNFCVYVC